MHFWSTTFRVYVSWMHLRFSSKMEIDIWCWLKRTLCGYFYHSIGNQSAICVHLIIWYHLLMCCSIVAPKMERCQWASRLCHAENKTETICCACDIDTAVLFGLRWHVISKQFPVDWKWNCSQIKCQIAWIPENVHFA